MKRIIMMLVIILGITGCTTGSSKGDTIHFASTKDISDINPHDYLGNMSAQNMVFEPLVFSTEKGIEPGLAESWDISSDGKVYTFSLRKNVDFTDGEPFTAEAVVANFDAIMANKERHGWMEFVNLIESYKAVDTHTFELVLSDAYYPVLVELSLTRPFRFISPKSMIDGKTHEGVASHVGTGPWILDEHKVNQYATFKRNDKHWNTVANASTVKWLVKPDHQSILLSLEAGEIDILWGSDGDMIDSNSFESVKGNVNYETVLSNPVASRAIVMNTTHHQLKSNHVRNALEYLVDRETISTNIFEGLEAAAYALYDPETVPYTDADLEKKVFNVEKAQTLLAEDGWVKNNQGVFEKDGKALEMTIVVNSDFAQDKMVAEFIQSQFKATGLILNIETEESQKFSEREQDGLFDMIFVESWGLPYDPASYLSSWRQPAHADYMAQLGLEKKAWMDSTITDLLVEVDEAKRRSMYHEVLSYVHDENVYIPLTYSKTKVVHSNRIQNVEFNVSRYEIPFERIIIK